MHRVSIYTTLNHAKDRYSIILKVHYSYMIGHWCTVKCKMNVKVAVRYKISGSQGYRHRLQSVCVGSSTVVYNTWYWYFGLIRVCPNTFDMKRNTKQCLDVHWSWNVASLSFICGTELRPLLGDVVSTCGMNKTVREMIQILSTPPPPPPLNQMAPILADDIFKCIFWMKM